MHCIEARVELLGLPHPLLKRQALAVPHEIGPRRHHKGADSSRKWIAHKGEPEKGGVLRDSLRALHHQQRCLVALLHYPDLLVLRILAVGGRRWAQGAS